MMALVMMLTLSQCKKQNEENEDNTAKVRVSCTIPLNNDGKTDFTNILENGTVNWSAETEKIYLAIPATQELVELISETATGGSTLTFSGNVTAGSLDITGETEYDVWYLGRSQDSKLAKGSVTGSIANQSGNLEDLGYHHIAKATVTASEGNNGGIVLSIGTFENQIAIAHLDLTNVAGLSGSAIVGTDYTLEYINGAYRLNVTTGDKSINITGSKNKNESYVVLFPTNAKDVELNSDSNKKITFHNGIRQNTLYKENDNQPLIWELPEHECVDLGLPSKVKWATCNIGAGSPEAYGKYYAWGEIEEPLPAEGYVPATCGTYNKRMNDISGHETYDAATANWGIGWRIPTMAECEELMNEEYCTWEWRSNNDFAGYKVTSKINGNYIFLPAAGFKSGSTDVINVGGVYGTYSCSTPADRGNDDDAEKSYTLGFKDETKAIGRIYRDNGRVVRPVTGGNFKNPAAQYAEVTTAEVSEITGYMAKCGGNVTVDKYSEVKERGVCYSTSENLTIENGNKVPSASAGEGEYTVELTGLQMNTLYYVRAYATTDAGISYGKVKSFTTINIVVKTSDVTNITVSTAECGGEVIANSEVKERGVCYSTSQNPTISDNIKTATPASGGYTVQLEGLTPNTTYYVKAYAVINSEVYYGELKSFKTSLENVNGHECVDLGLRSGVKWATCNVGANSPEEYGNYYAWGETEPAPDNNYSSSNCPTYGLTISQLKSQGYIDEEGNLTPYYDAAAKWGGNWRMPTYDELNELHTECEWTWTTQNGVKGCKVVGPNGNSIFLPAAGGYVGSSLEEVEKFVLLWSSKPSNITEYAYYLYFNDDINIDDCDMMEYIRYYGFSVRPVIE